MAFERRILSVFDADTSRHDRGTRRMQNQFRRLDRTSRNRLGAIDRRLNRLGKTFIATLAGAATIAAFRRFSQGVQGAIDKLDNIAKTADSIGVSTDALQEMRVAADLSGVAVDKFDQAMRRFARTASDANNGLSTAERAFEAVNVEVTNADGSLKDLDTLLAEVADGMGSMTDATQRAATAQELFGRGGTEMVNLLAKGSGEIERMRAEARRLGVVIDESLIRRSVEVKDELTLMNKQIEASTTVMLAEMAPALRDIAGFLADVAWAAGLAWRGMRRLAGVQLDAIAVPGLTADLEAARAELAQLDAQFQELASHGGQTALAESLGFKTTPEEFNDVLERFADRRAGIVQRIEELERDLATALGGGEDVVPSLPERPDLGLGAGSGGRGGALAAEATEERESALQREIRTLAERTNEILRMTAAQAALDPEMDGYAVALRAAEIEARLLARAEAEGVEVKGDLTERIRDVARAYAEAEAASMQLRETQSELDQAPRIFEDLGRGIGGAISQARTLEEALQNVLAVLAEIALRAALNAAFSGGGGGGGGGIFGSIFHKGGVVGQTAAPMRHLPAAAFLGAPRMHGGGIAGLKPNEVPAILEKGEIVVPKNIGMARASSVVVGDTHLHVNQPGATAEQLQRLLAEHRRETIREIVEMNEKDPDILHT